jgi:chemotaxis protein MotB
MKRCDTPWRRRASAALLPFALFAFAGCVSRGSYRELEAERDGLLQDKQALTERVQMLEASTESLGEERVTLIDQLETLVEAKKNLDRDVASLTATRAELSTNLQARESELAARQQEVNQLRGTYEGLVSDLEAEVAAGQIQIQQLREGLQLNLTQDVLFGSGSAELNEAGRSVLKKVAPRLKELTHSIEVQGHTDSIPITGALAARYPSNWELAAARASTVVRYLAERGVDPRRLSAVSHAEFTPIASNDTAEGRQKNRRIEMTLEPVRAPEKPAAAASPPAKAATPSEARSGQ